MLEASSEYERRYPVRFADELGNGKDGRVFRTQDRRAVKFAYDETNYRRELRAYQILRQRNIDQINGFQIPKLIRNDDELCAIEMTIVQPPFLLDFVAAYTTDEYARLGFSDEVLQEREGHWSEIFGERWFEVHALRDAFRTATGLILLDLSLNNIKFAEGESGN